MQLVENTVENVRYIQLGKLFPVSHVSENQRVTRCLSPLIVPVAASIEHDSEHNFLASLNPSQHRPNRRPKYLGDFQPGIVVQFFQYFAIGCRQMDCRGPGSFPGSQALSILPAFVTKHEIVIAERWHIDVIAHLWSELFLPFFGSLADSLRALPQSGPSSSQIPEAPFEVQFPVYSDSPTWRGVNAYA